MSTVRSKADKRPALSADGTADPFGELGVHKRTVGRWRSGELPVPRMAELALQAITSVAADVESGRFTPDPDGPDWLIRARELAKIRVPGED